MSPPSPDNPRRTLDHVPILHTRADMGSLAGAAAERRAPGHDAEAAVGALWDRIEAWAETLGPSLDGLRVYQDGLPVCDDAPVSELQLIAELASQGSRNHALLQRLHGRGAVIVGTESPPLLVQEYALARAVLAAPRPDPALASRARALLEQRDRFIAQRINATLPPAGAGVLFLGALHNPLPWLHADIRVRSPLDDTRRRTDAR